MTTVLQGRFPEGVLAQRAVNIDRCCPTLTQVITLAIYKERLEAGVRVDIGPSDHFFMGYAGRPEMGAMLGALGRGDVLENKKYMNRISADG